MAEIDLVPSDYRNRVMIYGWGKRLCVVLIGFLVFSLMVYVAFEVANRRIEKNVLLLQNRQQSVEQDRVALREITEKRDHYQRQWELLSYLRDSAAAARMFVIVDRAISAGDIWFLNWEFSRSGAMAVSPRESAGSGYFSVPSDNKNQGSGEAWEINTRMTIKGQASDHSALSRFVRSLYEQPEVDDVRILNTSRQNSLKVVNFDMVITVNSEQVAG